MLPKMIDVEAAAAYLGVSVSMLNKFRVRGAGAHGPHFYRFGTAGTKRGLIRYTHADLDAWAAEQRVA